MARARNYGTKNRKTGENRLPGTPLFHGPGRLPGRCPLRHGQRRRSVRGAGPARGAAPAQPLATGGRAGRGTRPVKGLGGENRPDDGAVRRAFPPRGGHRGAAHPGKQHHRPGMAGGGEAPPAAAGQRQTGRAGGGPAAPGRGQPGPGAPRPAQERRRRAGPQDPVPGRRQRHRLGHARAGAAAQAEPPGADHRAVQPMAG